MIIAAQDTPSRPERQSILWGMTVELQVRESVPLAPLTTLELGGPAEYLVEVRDHREVAGAVAWATARKVPLTILGGGSNVVVADQGVPGLVARITGDGLDLRPRSGDRVEVTAAAGQSWDELVKWTVAEGLAGLECLSGIPGTVGGTPVQNVGAYGQEVANTIVSVQVLDRRDGSECWLTPAQCGFGYRSSVLRSSPDRWIVLAVTFGLRRHDVATVRYDQLVEALGCAQAPIQEVREAVLQLRRSKSMVLDADDPNRRSAGSFFTNPTLSAAAAQAVGHKAVAAGLVRTSDELRQWPFGDGLVKLSAAWLIERAGFQRGERRGPVGLSSRHVLALVHHGGGSTNHLLTFAGEIQARVHDLFGVELQPEPVLLGVST